MHNESRNVDFVGEITQMENRQFGLLARTAGRLARGFRSMFVQRSLRCCKLSHASRIRSFTTRDELEALFALAHEARPDARVLEIGSYLGASTCYLAAGLRGASASITCVDTWHNETMPDGPRDTLREFEANLAPVRQRLHLIRRATRDFQTQDLGGPFDLVFIDGDHSYAQVRGDFALASSCLTDDGVLVFHDSRYYEGVSRVIGEAVATGRWQIAGMVMSMTWLVPARFVQPMYPRSVDRDSPTESPPPLLRDRAARGLKWQVAEMLGRQGFSFAVFMVLARLLQPADFGLVGLVAANLALINILVEQGIGTALVQRQNLEPDHANAAFWFNLLAATAICAATMALAAPIANIAGAPGVAPLLRWAALGLVINALGAVHASLFIKDIDFRHLTFRTLVGNAIGGGVAIAMAVSGYGVWSLIAQQLIAALVGVSFLWLVSPWRPAFRFSFLHLKQLLRVSSSVFVTSLLWTFSSRIDQIVIGRFAGAATLGQYVVGIKLADLARAAIHEPVAALSMPTFSKVQGDYQRLRNAIYHAIELHAVVCFAVFVGLASIATNAVPLLLGEQWREAAGILRLFSLYSLAVALSALYHPALLASGGPGRYVFINVVCAIGAAAACLIGIRFGVETVVALLTVNFLGISALALLFLRQRIGLNVRRFCQPLLKPAAAAALMFVVVTLTGAVLDRIMPLWLLTTTQVIVGAVTYLTVIGVWAPRTLLRLGEMAVASMSRDAVPAPQTTAYVDASYQA